MKNLYFKLAYRYDDVKKCYAGEIVKPLSATIFPSEICNLRCIYCHSESIHDGGLMSWDTYKKCLDELKEFGIKAIALEGGGEPMLNPHIGKFISYAKEIGLKVGILTNGTIYIDEMLKADWIRISLDVPRKDVFNYIKQPLDDGVWDVVIDNIKKLVANKPNSLTVGIKFMLSQYWRNKDACRQFADELGVDYHQEKYVRNHESSLVDSLAKKEEPCKLTSLKVVVDYDGTYYICPFFHHNKEMKIGKGDINKLWGSTKHKKAINGISPEKCALYDCPMRNIQLDRIENSHLEWI